MAITSDLDVPTASEAQRLGEQVVVGMALGYASSQMLFSAEELGLFELLADGPRELNWLAQNVRLSPGPLERLLIGCCALGLLSRDGDRFGLMRIAQVCLVRSSPAYVGGLFPFFKRGLYPVWEHLDGALREEKPQWENVPAIRGKGLFEALYRNEGALREFHTAAHRLSYLTGLAACSCFDFSQFRTIVDVGGGTGGFLAAVCECYPAVQGCLFDLPMIEKAATETIRASGQANRIGYVAGDFFRDPFPAADLYVFGDILHDWSVDGVARLLGKAHAALPTNGALCIAESLLNDQRDGPYLAAVMNLTMLLTAQGEQRSPKVFDALLREAGFSRSRHWFLPAPRDLVVGWKDARK